MPYKVKGKAVYHKVGDQWKKKQQCTSHENALEAMRLLQAIEHNPEFVPRGR